MQLYAGACGLQGDSGLRPGHERVLDFSALARSYSPCGGSLGVNWPALCFAARSALPPAFAPVACGAGTHACALAPGVLADKCVASAHAYQQRCLQDHHAPLVHAVTTSADALKVPLGQWAGLAALPVQRDTVPASFAGRAGILPTLQLTAVAPSWPPSSTSSRPQCIAPPPACKSATPA